MHHKVAALSNDQYEFSNPGKKVLQSYWFNFFQDQNKDELKKSWKIFNINYDQIWKLGDKTDHSTFKIHYLKVNTNTKLMVDEERGLKRKSFTYGLNGQHVFRSNNVFSLVIENEMKVDIIEPCDWTPGFFWKVDITFGADPTKNQGQLTHGPYKSSSCNPDVTFTETFTVFEAIHQGSKILYLTKPPSATTSGQHINKNNKYGEYSIYSVEMLEHRQHSMAMMQKYCIRFRGHPKEACLSQNIHQLGKRTPNNDDGDEDENDKNDNALFVQTSKNQGLRIQSTAVAARMKNKTNAFSRKKARVLINKTEEHIRSKYVNETDAFIKDEIHKNLRKKLQLFNSTFNIQAYSTKKLNLTITFMLTSFIVIFGFLKKKILNIEIKSWYLAAAVIFFVSPSLYEQYQKKTFAQFRVECRSSIGRALVSYLDQRVVNISGYNVSSAINVNRIKGKAEENANDYSVHRENKTNIDIQSDSVVREQKKKLYKIRMDSQESTLVPKLGHDWHCLESKLRRDSSNDSTMDTVKIYHQIAESDIDFEHNEKMRRSTENHNEIMRNIRRGGRRGDRYDDVHTPPDSSLDRAASLGPMKLSLPRSRYVTGHTIAHLTQVLQEYSDNNAIFQATRVISFRTLQNQIESLSSSQRGYGQDANGEVWVSPNNKEGRLKPEDYYWPMDDIQFCNSLKEMEADVKRFVESRSFYLARGIPFRRGYLLNGSPGCGKNYFIYHLAAVLGREVCVLDMASSQVKNMGDTGLVIAVNELGSNSILVLKNIDAIPMRETGGGKKKERIRRYSQEEKEHLTYTGVLNILDGPFAHSNGLITIMTTNRTDILKSEFMKRSVNALLRPGRCDLQIDIGLPTEKQIRNVISSIFSDENETLVETTTSTFINMLKQYEKDYTTRKTEEEIKEAEKSKEEKEAKETKEAKVSDTTHTAEEETKETKNTKVSDNDNDNDNSDAKPWTCFINIKSIQDYCIRWTNRKDTNPLVLMVDLKNVDKLLKQTALNNRQGLLYKMENSLPELKRSAKVLAKEGPPSNEDDKNQRAKQIQDAKYLYEKSISLETNVCSSSDAKNKHKKYGNMLNNFHTTIEKLLTGKKKPKTRIRCVEEDCKGILKDIEVSPYWDVKCERCNKNVNEFSNGDDEAKIPWARCKESGCDAFYCENCVDLISLQQEKQKAEKRRMKDAQQQIQSTELARQTSDSSNASNSSLTDAQDDEGDGGHEVDGGDGGDEEGALGGRNGGNNGNNGTNDNSSYGGEERESKEDSEMNGRRNTETNNENRRGELVGRAPATNPDVLFRQMSEVKRELAMIKDLLTDDGLRMRKKKAKMHWGSMKESWKIASQKMKEEQKMNELSRTSFKETSSIHDHPFM